MPCDDAAIHNLPEVRIVLVSQFIQRVSITLLIERIVAGFPGTQRNQIRQRSTDHHQVQLLRHISGRRNNIDVHARFLRDMLCGQAVAPGIAIPGRAYKPLHIDGAGILFPSGGICACRRFCRFRILGLCGLCLSRRCGCGFRSASLCAGSK